MALNRLFKMSILCGLAWVTIRCGLASFDFTSDSWTTKRKGGSELIYYKFTLDYWQVFHQGFIIFFQCSTWACDFWLHVLFLPQETKRGTWSYIPLHVVASGHYSSTVDDDGGKEWLTAYFGVLLNCHGFRLVGSLRFLLRLFLSSLCHSQLFQYNTYYIQLDLFSCVCCSPESVVSTRRHPTHPVSALILHPREIQALWSQNYDTGSYVVSGRKQ